MSRVLRIACALAFAVALAAPAVAVAPNPSGSGVPTAVVDTQLVTPDGDQPVVEGGPLVRNATYDLTFTNISTEDAGTGHGYAASTTGLVLCNTNGTAISNPRSLNPDLDHMGRYNVTFPSQAFPAVGEYALYGNVSDPGHCSAGGVSVARFAVADTPPAPAHPLTVTLAPSTINWTSGNVSFMIHVDGLLAGETASITGYGIPSGTVVTASSPDYVYFGPCPDPGQYGYTATVNGQPESNGVGILTVLAPPPAKAIVGTYSAKNGQIKFGKDAPVTGAAYDLTVTKLVGVTPFANLTLRDPNGAQVGPARMPYIDGEHAGAFNVTFPQTTFRLAGTYTLEGPGFSAAFVVKQAHGRGK